MTKQQGPAGIKVGAGVIAGGRLAAGVIAAGVLIAVLAFLPLFVPRYYVYLLATIMVTALLANSLNFVLGYGGLLQLHHCVFYGVGAYAAALMLAKTAWPFWLAVLAGPLTAAAAALAIGWFCVRLRGLYFGMLTLALGQLVWAVVYRWYKFTGGDDGIHGVPIPAGIASINASYYFILLFCVISMVILYLVVKSPFGLTLQAVRDNPARGESIGVNIKQHQLAAFVLSGLFAGLAGVLFVVLERSVSPALLFWNKSAEILIMCLLGGMFTFFGPILGAAAIVVISTVVGVYTEYWLFVLGFILLAVVLFLPQGILGFLLEVTGGNKAKGLRGRLKADVGS